MTRAQAVLGGLVAATLVTAAEAGLLQAPLRARYDLAWVPGPTLLAGMLGAGAAALVALALPRAAPWTPALLSSAGALDASGLPDALLRLVLGLVAGAAGRAAARRPPLAAALAALPLVVLPLARPRADPTPAREPGRPDLVLVVLDTVAARDTSLHGAPLPTTPTLEALAREGTWFRRATSPSCWTVPAHCGLFTGRDPGELGCGYASPTLPAGVPTTAERLAALGYRTGAFTGNPWLGPELGLTRGFGFRVPVHLLARAIAVHGALGLLPRRPSKGGTAVVQQALAWLDLDRERPAFAFLNLLEPHTPYLEAAAADRFGVPDAAAVSRRSRDVQHRGPGTGGYPRAGEAEAAWRLHAGAVRAADDLLGRLVAGLRSRGMLDRTLLVVTADHGEAFGEHGIHGHAVGLREEVVHVPLVLRWPGQVVPGRVVDAPVSLLDVHPTLLAAAGDPAASPGLLAPAPDPERAIVARHERPTLLLVEGAWGERQRGGPWDFASVRVQVGDRVALRELPSAGPARTLVGRWPAGGAPHLQPGEDERLAPLLDAAAASLERPARAPAPPPETIQEQLRALGYVGD